MDKNTEFKWNDKLVQDYIQFYAASYAASVAYFNSDETLEKFKQSKSKKEEPQWEILDYINPNVFTDILGSNIVDAKGSGANYAILKNFPIHSVKRFPDNTVWSVDGSYFINGYMATLKRFELSENGKMIVYFNGLNIGYELSELPTEKAPKEEQVPIKVESIVFYTSMSEKPIRDVFSVRLTGDISEDKLQPIKKAIQSVINNDGLSEYFNKQPKLYSESELLLSRREGFDAGRAKYPTAGFKYDTFEDYINSLK